MKKIKSTLLLAPALILTTALSSCGQAGEDKTIIRILHQEDYMDESLIQEFEKENPGVKVVFDKSETNETLYSEIQMGKSQYDIVTCSEYMVQRLANENLIQQFDTGSEDFYELNLSNYLRDKINNIHVNDVETGKVEPLGKYGKGYMWGTLGIIVNPYYADFISRGMDKEKVLKDLQGDDGWSAFWNPEYKRTQSIKDSMRDTYAMGIFEVFKDEFMSEEISDPDKRYEHKNSIFNDHSPETIDKVKQSLIDLKGNIFGFEVDSGKNDIVTGKIGMNLAWSGDAGFSIDTGYFSEHEDADGNLIPLKEEDQTKLYYIIPTLASNIWFDAFCMPKRANRTEKEYEYAVKFVNFMSRADSVVANMDYTGFTSFMSGSGVEGNEIAEYVKDKYEKPEQEGAISYDITYFFNDVQPKEMEMHVNPDSYEGRKLVASYPEKDDTNHLYVMEDYGKDNGKIVQMWEDIKVNPLPTWVIVLLVTFLVLTFGYLGCYKIIKAYKFKKRKALRKN